MDGVYNAVLEAKNHFMASHPRVEQIMRGDSRSLFHLLGEYELQRDSMNELEIAELYGAMLESDAEKELNELPEGLSDVERHFLEREFVEYRDLKRLLRSKSVPYDLSVRGMVEKIEHQHHHGRFLQAYTRFCSRRFALGMLKQIRTDCRYSSAIGEEHGGLTTPNLPFCHMQLFQEQLVIDEPAILCPVSPRHDSAESECIQDVAAQVQEHGGSMVLGWVFWEWPHVMAEAWFHAVWRSRLGYLIDVCARRKRELQILFVPDEKLYYRGWPPDNRRVALSDHPIVSELIRVCEEYHERMTAFRERCLAELSPGEEAEIPQAVKCLSNERVDIVAQIKKLERAGAL